jgi:hypothetical protein
LLNPREHKKSATFEGKNLPESAIPSQQYGPDRVGKQGHRVQQGAVKAGAVLAPALTTPVPVYFCLKSSEELPKFDLYHDYHLPLRSMNFDRINFDLYKF